jgi:two-component system, cell cycle response regulator
MSGRILIADTSSGNRILLRARLSEARYDVRDAGSAQEVLEIVRRDRPDLLIADERLPGGGGVALLRTLRADPALARLPVILLTERGERASRIAALAAGADEFLVKPVDEIALMARVRSIFRASETEDALARRRVTVEELGFAEAPPGFAPAPRLAFVARTPAEAADWARGIEGLVRAPVETLGPAEALALADSGPAPDLFLIAADLTRPGEGLSLLVDLRSRSATRYAAVLLLHRQGDSEGAALALDLGANDILPEGFHPAELAIRIRTQLRRKTDADRLRASVEDGLRLAVTDHLTGLYNRRYALSHLQRIAEGARASGRSFAVMVADVDRFKSVNDSYGHAAGDAVLAEIARRLRDNLRPTDLVARFGGEEFLIAMPDSDLAAATIAAERLRRTVSSTPIAVPGSQGHVGATVSIGVAVSDPAEAPEPSVAELIDRADRALLAAKSEGRNQVTVSRPAA